MCLRISSQSIHFTFTVPDPPFVDPPLPEDGVPYQAAPGTVQVGDYTLHAQWLPAESSIIPKDEYNDSLALLEDQIFVLAGKTLYTFSRNGSQLSTAADPITLDDEYRYLSADWNGTIYITDGYYQGLTLKDGNMQEYELDGYLTVHPQDQWGLCYWSSYNVKKITFTDEGMATKDWILTDLADDTARQGRFSTVNYIAITSDAIFVAGSDATMDNATRIAMYDFDGNELVTFGGADWLDDSAFSSVSGIVQTENGILVQDNYDRNYKLFALDGTFIGLADTDDLLGTDYPWPVAMVASENGALAMVAQEREDHSAVELLIFEITGF